jgi:manganese/iron transport system substrate-binding protein
MTSIIKFPLHLKPLSKRLSRVSLVITFALSLASCATNPSATNPNSVISPTTNASSSNTAPSPSANLPKVVVTHSVLCDITKEIAQTTIDLQCLIAAGADPHEYQAKPEDKRAIEQAKLILYGGYNFEPGLIKMIQSSQTSVPKIAVSELAVPKPLKGEEDHDHSKDQAGKPEEKAKDHDHGEFDPHIWHNAQNGVQMVQVVRDQLKALSPENANLYTTNAEKLTKNLQEIDTWIKAQMQTIPTAQKQLITTHESMSYFADAYGIKLEGALQGITTEEQPTASRIAALVQEIKSTKVPTIFPEASINPGLMKVVAKEANVQVAATPIFGDGIGEKGSPGDSYLKMLTSNTCTIVNGLGGKCTPFVAK